MEFQEEYTQIIMKGKRTKRPRQSSPLALTMASTSSSLAEAGSATGGSDNSAAGGGGFDRATTSTTNSGEFPDHRTEEEEDMANCLILLAQGQTLKLSDPEIRTVSKAGLCAYQCKTCDRCFPSFQALGGHRASHNKPSKFNLMTNGDDKKSVLLSPLVLVDREADHEYSTNTTLSLRIPNRVSPSHNNNNSNSKSRVHECSVCGAEFSSGQALGGHMRRHRTMSMAATTTTSSGDESQEAKKSKNVLALDLNLPAPDDHHEDRHRESKFVFASKKQVIVFSASSLVDCHY